jgi:predicted nucleotidyltransferase component of viral defense system
MVTNPLQKREIFHLAFLRALVRSVPVSTFALKGGCNLRFFFGSVRYSEDMDLDVSGLPVDRLRDKVMTILESSGLIDTLRIFGIERIQPPNVSRAKQTETMQRFKVHLLTTAGEDLYTSIECSRRGLEPSVRSEAVSAAILAAYRLPPIIVPHYTAVAAARQKIQALLSRRQTQARDVFDLYTLSSQPEVLATNLAEELDAGTRREVRDRIYAIDYSEYRDTVVSFLAPEDRTALDSSQIWDEIKLRAASLIAQRNGENG